MLTKTPHLFDDATAVTAGDSRWQGRTSDEYWAFVGDQNGELWSPSGRLLATTTQIAYFKA